MLPLCDATRQLFMPLPTDSINPLTDKLEISHNKNEKFIVDTYRSIQGANGSYRVSPSYGIADLFARLPEAKRMKLSKNDKGYYDPWEVAATDISVELINTLAPASCLEFADEYAREHWQAITQRAQLADMRATIASQYKLDKVVTPHDLEFAAGEFALADYQQIALMLQQMSSGFLQSGEQGTGKTPVAIASICNGVKRLRAEGSKRFYLTLIVVPKNILSNWCEELAHFSTRGGRITVLDGTQIERTRRLSDALAPDDTGVVEFSAVIVSYASLWRSWEAIQMVPWDLSILDEAHAIKDTNAEQSQSCIRLRDISRQRIAMTGTPIANSMLDLYNILEFLEKGGSGFSSKKAFNKYYGKYATVGGGRAVLTGCDNLPVMQERLVRNSFFISKAEALPDLPEVVRDHITCEMTPQQSKCYNDLADQLALEIENTLAQGGMTRQLVVTNILTKLLRLAQITSGFVSWDAVNDEMGNELQPKCWEYFENNPKIAALCELLEAKDPTEKTIVWVNWIPDLEYVVHCCTEMDIKAVQYHGSMDTPEREAAIEAFNADRDCKVFVGTSAGGCGLNLLGYPPHQGEAYDTDCTHVIHYSQNWSSIQRGQKDARPHRRGTRRNVRITDLVVENSIDEQIRTVVMAKQIHALEVGDLRKIMSAALGRN